MPVITEVHQAAGAFTVPFRRAPELETLLDYYDHIQFWWGETLIAQGPYLRERPKRGLRMVEGQLLPWWLGVDKEGPLIELARYRSGLNMLPNGQFEHGDLNWAVEEDSEWLLGVGAGMGGGLGAKTTPTNHNTDDFIVSDRSFEAFPGDTLRLRMWMRNTDPEPRFNNLHTRIVFDGRFGQPNMLPTEISSSMWDASGPGAGFSTDDTFARTPPALAYVGATPKAQFITNGGFESGSGDDADDWTRQSVPGGANRDSTTPHSGGWSMKFDDDNFGSVLHDVGPLNPDDELVLTFWAAQTEHVSTSLRVTMLFSDDDQEVFSLDPGETGWHRYDVNITVPSSHDGGFAELRFRRDEDGGTAGEFYRIDDVSLTRVRGNTVWVATADTEAFNPAYRGNFIKVIPGYSYTVEAWIRSQTSCTHGEAWIRTLTREDYDDGTVGEVYQDSNHIGLTNGEYVRVAIEVTPPSGHNWMRIAIWGQDVYGGGMHVDDVTCRLTDNNVRPVNSAWDPITDPDGEIHNMDATVPKGARSFHVEIGVEAHGANWEIDDVKLLWTGPQAVAAAEDIVGDFATAAGLFPGDINAAGSLAFDWVVRDMFVRDALDELCHTGVVLPRREWRVRPDGSLDFGLPEEIHTDRSAAVVFAEGDSWLVDEPDAMRSRERFVTEVKVVGADRDVHRGHHSIVRTRITGRASNSPGSYTRFDGSPFARARLEENGGADTQAFADAIAQEIADDSAEEHESYDLELKDWRTLGAFDVGDWLGVYHPSDGIEDAARPLLWDGETIYPKKLRAISREWTLGSGPFRVLLRRGVSSSEAYLALSGTGYAQTSDHASLDITGDIDIRAVVALDDWTPATETTLANKADVGASMSYLFDVLTNGKLRFAWSANGSVLNLADSSVAPTVTDSQILAVRVTGQVPSTVKFYTKATTIETAAADAASDSGWTQLGTTQTTGATAAIFSGSSSLRVGNNAVGKVAALVVKNGINGTTVANPDFTSQTPETMYFTDDAGRAWTLRNPSILSEGLRVDGANWAESSDHSSLDVTGDLDLRVAAAAVDWTPGSAQVFAAKLNGSDGTDIAYQFYLNTDGTLEFLWSPDGSTQKLAQSTTGPSVADSFAIGLRVTLDVDNGGGGNTVSFYTKAITLATSLSDIASNAGWTLLGSTRVTAGTTSIHDSGQPLRFGANPLAGLKGVVYAGVLKNGINGTTVANPDFYGQDAGVSSFVDDAGRNWSVRGGSSFVGVSNEDTDTTDVSEFVEWPAETRARVEVGDKRPDFISNPQGGPLSKQFLKWRTSGRVG